MVFDLSFDPYQKYAPNSDNNYQDRREKFFIISKCNLWKIRIYLMPQIFYRANLCFSVKTIFLVSDLIIKPFGTRKRWSVILFTFKFNLSRISGRAAPLLFRIKNQYGLDHIYLNFFSFYGPRLGSFCYLPFFVWKHFLTFFFILLFFDVCYVF